MLRADSYSIEGVRAVDALLRSPAEIVSIVHLPVEELTAPAREGLHAIRALAGKRGISVREVGRREARSVFSAKTPQGLAAVARVPADLPLESIFSNRTRVLILDGLNDPGNVGTLLRSAHLLGWEVVLTTPGTVSPYSPKAARASAGAIGFVRHASAPASAIAAEARKAGMALVEAVASGGEEMSFARSGKIALILGGEARGSISSWRGARQVTLDTISSPVDSFSVATGGSILLYELRSP